jgi:hypothetical protein
MSLGSKNVIRARYGALAAIAGVTFLVWAGGGLQATVSGDSDVQADALQVPGPVPTTQPLPYPTPTPTPVPTPTPTPSPGPGCHFYATRFPSGQLVLADGVFDCAATVPDVNQWYDHASCPVQEELDNRVQYQAGIDLCNAPTPNGDGPSGRALRILCCPFPF